MCNKLELIYSSFFSTIGSVLYLASTRNPRLWQLSESAWYKAAHYHKSPSHRDFSRTTLQTPALLRLNIFPETKHYFLLRNRCLLNVCYSTSNPLLIGRMYLKYLFDTEMLRVNIRMDRGTETGKLATIHVYLLNQHGLMDDPTDSIIFGPSTSNKIERWWRDLHERLEVFF